MVVYRDPYDQAIEFAMTISDSEKFSGALCASHLHVFCLGLGCAASTNPKNGILFCLAWSWMIGLVTHVMLVCKFEECMVG